MNWMEHRIPPPLVAVLFGVLMWLLARWVPGIDAAAGWRIALALLVLAAGVAVCLSGVLSFRHAGTTVNPLQPETASSLVSSGIYRHTRNPMYLGFAIALVAWSIYLASPVALLGVAGFVLYMNRFQIGPEEQALATLFGESFSAYRGRVRRWL
ncbi:isoprenylcysteine carboxylmethyltransferase family protein [Pseudomonas sp. BN515]|uniref:methyltransferase family protein n=1 Tax=Pseudomonas sp. BN515 TaxID=2567892 RepID=UPI0024564FE2|nr:isoprenylcysteine carboxylmethyltransferase family protein [Pseudomonas sp. BN515]MDH4873470.1 isoprenylcysteine carboxylmethyltransferase family protein [Pseudomonas sp. BN515]